MKLHLLVKTTFLLVAASLLCACAAKINITNKCHKINWRRLGFQDGLYGKPRQNLDENYAHCDLNLVLGEARYYAGWQEGVKTYCNSRNGLRLGMQGILYNNICPNNQVSAFDKAWRKGLRHYCTPSNGFKRGLRGDAFPGYCAPDLSSAFKSAYDQGSRAHKTLATTRYEYEKLNDKVKIIQHKVRSEENALRAVEKDFSKKSFSPQKQYHIQKRKIHLRQCIVKRDELMKQRDEAYKKYKQIKASIRRHY